MMRRILAMLHARNLEFLRDRAALAWNLILPVMLVFGLAFIFSGGDKAIFKVAVKTENAMQDSPLNAEHCKLLYFIVFHGFAI